VLIFFFNFKVVAKVIQHCQPSSLVQVANTACLFMEEVNSCSVVKESDHDYEKNFTAEDKVHIPGAAYLTVKFDQR